MCIFDKQIKTDWNEEILLYGVVISFSHAFFSFSSHVRQVKTMLQFDIRALKTMFENIENITINDLNLQIFFIWRYSGVDFWCMPYPKPETVLHTGPLVMVKWSQCISVSKSTLMSCRTVGSVEEYWSRNGSLFPLRFRQVAQYYKFHSACISFKTVSFETTSADRWVVTFFPLHGKCDVE